METRLTNVEVKLAFQDDLLEALNHTVATQQRQIDLLQGELQMLYQQFKALQPSLLAANGDDEPPPPHY